MDHQTAPGFKVQGVLPLGLKDHLYPLGATLIEGGVHFAVYSGHGEAVDLCLYDPDNSSRETARVRMAKDVYDVWHATVPGLGEGALYGYRVHGPWKPEWGFWFNSRKLLLDPYAKAIQGDYRWAKHLQNLSPKKGPDWHDNGAQAMKSVVVNDQFDWSGDVSPSVAWKDTVIYETHVKGLTYKHPDVPEELRGTYAGLAHPSVTQYLKSIGVTAVQLIPIHQHLDDGFLLAKNLTNYWGYNTIGFFAPHPEYAGNKNPQAVVNEFKCMVRELHREGIEVILDVVYNHTAEGDENGPQIFLRGLDNPAYYMLNQDHRTLNYTGTGNTVNAAAPVAMRMIMDSLRYWVEVMHVDGFRFDLGATLGRNGASFNRASAFFLAVAQDPVLSKVKLIAEPWDIGPDGYQVGGFPQPWHELNGRYRDDARRFWAGDTSVTADLAKRLCGSSDIYGPGRRSAYASVNFITSHDGFTLRDLWSYNEKHNIANGEDNRDGDGNNHSWNCGVEGDTEDEAILALRLRLTRAMLATTMCSLGVPFINAGDERWRTQQGNNNAYCQDNEISWVDWQSNPAQQSVLTFMQEMAAFRRQHPVLRRASFFNGALNPFTGRPDVAWYDQLGLPMTHESWHDPAAHFFAGLFDALDGEPAPLLLLFNGLAETVSFPLPEGEWMPVFDTANEASFVKDANVEPIMQVVEVAARSVACLVLKMS